MSAGADIRSWVLFQYRRLHEKLWTRPLLFSILAVVAAFAAAAADGIPTGDFFPEISNDTIEKILSLLAASMLGVATFAVGSMVSAYASVSRTATPRAFSLVVADDVSKTALSTFIGAFMFSVIALVALRTGLYGRTGLFVLFAMTILVVVWIVFSFIRWVDPIARLGRLNTTILRVERAAHAAIDVRRRASRMGALPRDEGVDPGKPAFAREIGYVQHIDMAGLQACAEKHGAVITLHAVPGTFVAPDRPLASVRSDDGREPGVDSVVLERCFHIGHDRSFDEDPRFGLIALSEIAGRALSPAVNDPGTAIAILGVLVRLMAQWAEPSSEESGERYDRLRAPELSMEDLFDDAFTAIERDGASSVEVMIRAQKALASLSSLGHEEMRAAARRHARIALTRAEAGLELPDEVAAVRALAAWASA